MKRIGIAASRIAKDDLILYNLFVIVLSFLVALLIFFIVAFVVLAGMALTSYVMRGFMAIDTGSPLFRAAAIGLLTTVGVLFLAAVSVNFKLKR